MRRGIAAIGLLLAVSVAAVPSTAKAGPPARVTIVAVFEPIVYGQNAYVNGQLLGDGQGGQPVALEQSAPPFTDWAPVAQVAADAQGYYSFKLRPSQTMQYRTGSQGTGSERIVQISVAPRIKLKAEAVSKTTVRYSGTFAPALAGQTVAIQRRLPGGGWANITNARLHDGRTFSGRFRARHTMSVRAFFETNGALLSDFSKVVKITRGAG
ncbi:MAG TPA: hypothetical protein VF066_04295 [Thermoleophilaceae bacterium]